jgi:uncharacterized protein
MSHCDYSPLRISLLALAFLFSVPSSHAEETLTLTLGTATPGGSFSAYGQALAQAIGESDPLLKIELRATKGSAENVPLLETGKLDLALVEGTVVHEALTGVGRTRANLPVVSAMFPSPGMFVVLASSNYRSIRDLKGQRVVFGAQGSGLVVLARYILEGLGLSMRKDFDAVLLESAKDGPPMVLSGSAAALWGGGLGWPAFDAVARGPQGARFIGLDAEDMARIQAQQPFLKSMPVQPHSYPGQDYAITTVGTWSLILARADLPDEFAYRFARALHRGHAALARRYPAAWDPSHTLAAMPPAGVVHAGVARYFKEAGLTP